MSAASYLSSFLTTTTSKYNNLKQALNFSEGDGDTEDDTNISRVLRGYYTEKGRPFPEWLPPDPKAPPPPMPSQYAASSTQSLPTQSSGRWGRSGGISDLWDGPKQQEQPQAAPQSLRPRFNQQQPMDSGPPAPMGGGRSGRFGDLYESSSSGPGSGGISRKTPGSRFQTQDSSPAPSVASGSTTKDMLKAKLLGGRTGSPTPSTGSGGGYAPPQRQGSPAFNSGGANPYGKDTSSGSGRFGGYGSQSSYSDDRSGYGSEGNSQNPSFSNPSWSGGDSSQGSTGGSRGYGGGPYSQSGQRQPPGQRVGLPSGPRPRRF